LSFFKIKNQAFEKKNRKTFFDIFLNFLSAEDKTLTSSWPNELKLQVKIAIKNNLIVFL